MANTTSEWLESGGYTTKEGMYIPAGGYIRNPSYIAPRGAVSNPSIALSNEYDPKGNYIPQSGTGVWKIGGSGTSPGGGSGGGTSVGTPTKALQWIPQSVKSSTSTSTRSIGELPTLPEYEELDENKLKSRTQEFSALGRREARNSFQELLSRIFGANPDDPYAKNLARTASKGFSVDTQRAISAGAKEALSVGLSDQQQRNQRKMTAYNAAVNAVLSSATTTTTQTYEYAPTPMQAMPTGITPTGSQKALSTQYKYTEPLSLGSPYTYG